MSRTAENRVDAVVVSYNSARTLRSCVSSLAESGCRTTVVDNASGDGCLDTIADLPATVVRRDDNRGFAFGCNVGIATGSAPYVLLLNPDAVIDADSVESLARVLDGDPGVGIAAPRILDRDGTLEPSIRRFPRLRSTYAVALFAHRLFPRASWQDELIRDPGVYEKPASVPWVSGACMLVRRSVLEELGGLDDGFFLYGEDVDLCRRTRDLGYDIRYEPGAVISHVGGSSAPRPELLPVLAASRLRYALKHEGPVESRLTRLGVAFGAITHLLLARPSRRKGHLRALLVALAPGDLDDAAAVAQRAFRKRVAPT